MRHVVFCGVRWPDTALTSRGASKVENNFVAKDAPGFVVGK